jgi:hypothetical protein
MVGRGAEMVMRNNRGIRGGGIKGRRGNGDIGWGRTKYMSMMKRVKFEFVVGGVGGGAGEGHEGRCNL